MNSEEFIDAIREVVVNDSIKGLESYLIKPSGRNPGNEAIEKSYWYNKLSKQDKLMVLKVIKEAVETSVFGFLCVLDGVRAIENTEEKGKLKLFYEREGNSVLLNNNNEDYLHDLL